MSKKNTLTKEQIDKIIHNSTFDFDTVFDKCTVVSMQLPNGFVLTESSACVDPDNYDEKLGYDICVKKLTERVWELEGYLLQSKLDEEKRLKEKPDRYFESMTIAELNNNGFAGELFNGSIKIEFTGNPVELSYKMEG